MRDEPLSSQHSITTEADKLAQLDQRLIHALEIAPEPQIPADFAARVAGLLPARPSVSLTPTNYGHYAMLFCMVVLMAALLLLAPRATSRSPFELTFQWILCAQFIGLAVWFSARRRGES